MDIVSILRAVAGQFVELQSPFGQVKAAVLALILLLSFASGLRGRRPSDGLSSGDVLLVGMLVSLINVNALAQLMQRLPHMLQASFGINLFGPTVASRLVAVAVLLLMLVVIAGLALACFRLMRGLGEAIGRRSRPGNSDGTLSV